MILAIFIFITLLIITNIKFHFIDLIFNYLYLLDIIYYLNYMLILYALYKYVKYLYNVAIFIEFIILESLYYLK